MGQTWASSCKTEILSVHNSLNRVMGVGKGGNYFGDHLVVQFGGSIGYLEGQLWGNIRKMGWNLIKGPFNTELNILYLCLFFPVQKVLQFSCLFKPLWFSEVVWISTFKAGILISPGCVFLLLNFTLLLPLKKRKARFFRGMRMATQEMCLWTQVGLMKEFSLHSESVKKINKLVRLL